MDSHRLQSSRSKRCEWQANHREVDYRRRPQANQRCALEKVRCQRRSRGWLDLRSSRMRLDPEMLACTSEKKDSCLAPEKAAAIKKAMGGPKTATGTQVYAVFLYDTGITNGPPFRGLLSP